MELELHHLNLGAGGHNPAHNKLLIEDGLMTSYVTTEKSPNLSEPGFLHQGSVCHTFRHSERIQGGKRKCLGFLGNWIWRIKNI